MSFDQYNRHTYSYVWGIDTPIYLSMLGNDDPVKVDINIKDCMRALGMCPNIILCYNSELDNKDPFLDPSTTSWCIKI